MSAVDIFIRFSTEMSAVDIFTRFSTEMSAVDIFRGSLVFTDLLKLMLAKQ
jgi:hypothetical protein